MKIAMLGTRGVPAGYSGFETCVEQLGLRLVQRGHEVTVYCRPHHVEDVGPTYRGMRLVRLPTLQHKYLDTIVHTGLSSLHALGEAYEVALYFIAGNSPWTWIPRLAGTRTALNVDGLDWKRDKWPGPAKRYLQLAEWLAGHLPDLYLTDSPAVQQHYRRRTGVAPPCIVYGSDLEPVPPGETLARFGLEPRRYILFVGRLEKENNPHHLIEAFRGLETDCKCVIVGDAAYAEAYKRTLREMTGDHERIIFTGYVFGRGYRELGSNAYAYVATTGVGGTHPALVEAMALGNCCIVNDTPVNLLTLAGHGLCYDGDAGGEGLRPVLRWAVNHPRQIARYRQQAACHAARTYSWQTVTDQYERMCYELTGDEPPPRLAEVESKVFPTAAGGARGVHRSS